MHDDPPMIEELRGRFYPAFERRWRVAETVGRLAMLGVVATTLGGLLGGGPVAVWTRTVAAEGLRVTYQPVARFGTPSGLDIAAPVPPGATEVAITLPDAIAADFDLQAVTPRPVRWEPGASAMRLVFKPKAGETSVVLHVGGMPPKAGLLRLSAHLDDRAALAWTQFILP